MRLIFLYYFSKEHILSDDSDDDSNQLEEVAIKFRDKILGELSQMENSTELESGSIEQKLKIYMGFFKLVQSLEEMIKRVQQERDKNPIGEWIYWNSVDSLKSKLPNLSTQIMR